jgi:crossover junction endonuclease MUS81
MFARHLMRLRGLSVERAHAIVQKYPTITALMQAYDDCSTDKEREMLVGGIYFGTSGRTIGPSISRTLFKLYNSSILK